MHPALIFGLAFGAMAGCAVMAQAEVAAENPPVVYAAPPEGYPWKIGEATISLDGAARSYTTFDFSIGAFDSAVQFRAHYDCSGSGACKDTGKIALHMRAHPDGNAETENDVVDVIAVFNRLPSAAKKPRAVEVVIHNVGGQEGSYLRAKGRAKLVLSDVTRGVDGDQHYGHFKATVTATVCEATEEALIKGGACHVFKAEYDTGVQYDSL